MTGLNKNNLRQDHKLCITKSRAFLFSAIKSKKYPPVNKFRKIYGKEKFNFVSFDFPIFVIK